ncbi:MAG: FkbM family methyltransferase [Thermoanaerobaculia bacterium]
MTGLLYLAVAAAIAVTALAVAAALVLRRKNRLLWGQIWGIESQLTSIRSQLLSLEKSALLQSVADARLPAMLPSQHGEDLLAWRFFGGKRAGTFVEAGAFDGIGFSNTYFLEAMGWHGLLIEPNPVHFESCRKNRPFSTVVHAALDRPGSPGQTELTIPTSSDSDLEMLAFTNLSETHRRRLGQSPYQSRTVAVPTATLNELLEAFRPPLDLLSLDLEGSELRALEGIDLDLWQPALIVVEDNANSPSGPLHSYLAAFGYEERLRAGPNLFFARKGDRRSFEAH